MPGFMERDLNPITYFNGLFIRCPQKQRKNTLGIICGVERNLGERAFPSLALVPLPLEFSILLLQISRIQKHDFRNLSYNQGHIPGANVRGTNFVATPDRIYLIQEDECLVLDPETGQTLKVFSLPGQDKGERAHWAYIGVYEDYLIAGAGFVPYSPLLKPADETSHLSARFVDKSASRSLVRWPGP